MPPTTKRTVCHFDYRGGHDSFLACFEQLHVTRRIASGPPTCAADNMSAEESDGLEHVRVCGEPWRATARATRPAALIGRLLGG